MSVTTIKAALVTALETVESLKRVYDQMPETINERPCALVLPRTGLFHTLGGRTASPNFEVTLLVARVGDVEEGQAKLDTYLDNSTGADSIVNAVESSTYGFQVTGWRDYGGLEYPPGSGNVFLGLKFDIRVIA